MGVKSALETMKKQPYISAGDLSPEELRLWLNRVADSAGVKTDGMFEIVSSLRLLADELKKQGVEIARRTVAKYRVALKIAPSHLRKAF